MDGRIKTFVNPCKMYARVKGRDVFHINGYKVELDTIILYIGSSAGGYKEEHFMLDEVEIFDWH